MFNIQRRKKNRNPSRRLTVGRRFEALEARRLLTTVMDLSAATPAPSSLTYTDSDGDIVTLRLEGLAGIVNITSDDSVAANGMLDNGEEILAIDITTATTDFVLSYSVNSTTNAGADGHVQMGEITSNRIIRGLYTVADTTGGGTPVSDFELFSFHGLTFSSGGGLNVDRITGNAAGESLVLTQSMTAGRVVNVRNEIMGDVVFGPGSFGGTINVNGNVGAGAWRFNGAVLSSGLVGAVNGDFDADVIVTGNYEGMATIAGDANGFWRIDGHVLPRARFQAREWDDVFVMHDFHGAMAAIDAGGVPGNGILLEVGGILSSTARITSADRLELTVDGSVLPGAMATADSNGIISSVGGNFYGTYVSYSEVILSVTGSMIDGRVHSGSNVFLQVGGSMTGSQIGAQSELSVDVGTSMTNSILFSSSSDINLLLGGTMFDSTLTSGEGISAAIGGSVNWSVVEGSEGDVSLSIMGSINDSRLTSGSESLAVSVGGSVNRSSLSSLESDVALSVGGSMTQSNVTAVTDLSLSVAGSMTDSNVEGASDVSVSIGQSMTRSSVFNDETGDVTLSIGNSMIDSRASSGSNNVSVAIGDNMINSQLFSGESEVTLTLGNDMVDSSVFANLDVTVAVGGTMNVSTVANGSGLVDVTAGMSILGSRIFSGAGDVSVTTGSHLQTSHIAAKDQSDVTVGGDFSSSAHVSDGSLTLAISGTMIYPSFASAAEDLQVTAHNLHGALQSDRLDLNVANDVGSLATIQANRVLDLNGDLVGFRVGDDFDGKLDVTTSFDTGAGASATLVGDVVGAAAKFNVTGDLGNGASAAEFVFGGAFFGELILGNELIVDLRFLGFTSRVNIAGPVLSTIAVIGAIDFLSTGSLFDPATGSFIDGVGTVTGNLTTTGTANHVTPTVGNLDPFVLPLATLDLNPATAAPNNVTYTDSDGDIVTIRLEGLAGTAVITSDESVAANGLLDDGEEILAIDITGAKSDVVLSFSVDSSTNGAADGHVQMGEITSNRIIRGIYTVSDTSGGGVPESDFELTSFHGLSFSSGGGLNVDRLTGNSAGEALVLTQSLPAGRVVHVGDDILQDVVFGPGSFGGTVNSGENVGPGTWSFNGSVLSSALITVDGDFNADVVVTGNFEGLATIAGDSNSPWEIRGSVPALGRLQARQWIDVNVVHDFHGAIATVDAGGVPGVTVLDVGGFVGSTARVMSAGTLAFDVGSNVLAGAMASANDITTTVGSIFYGTLVAPADITLVVTGSMINGRVVSGRDTILDVGGSLTGSQVGAKSQNIALVGSGMTNSILFSGSDDIVLNLGGTMLDSTLTSGEGISALVQGSVNWSVIEGSEGAVVVSVDGSLNDVRITSGSEPVNVVVGSSMNRSTVSSLESDVTLSVGGSMTQNHVTAVSDVTLSITGNMTDSNIEGASDVTVSIGQSMIRSRVFNDESGDVALAIGNSMIDSRASSGSNDVNVAIGDNMINSQLFSGESRVTLAVGDDMVDSSVFANLDVAVAIGRTMDRSTVANGSNLLAVSVGTNMFNSRVFSSSGDVNLAVGSHLLSSHIAAENSSTVTTGGDFSSSIHVYNGDLALDIGGTMLYPSFVAISGDLQALMFNLHGALQSDRLDLDVANDVGSLATIQANEVLDLNGDNVGFRVGDDFDGKLDVATSFDTGVGASAVLIGDTVGAAAKFNVTGDFGTGASSARFAFVDYVFGEVSLGSSLVVDLSFGASLARAMIGGPVFADIVTGGFLTSLTTGSLFIPTTPGDGNFVDGVGTITGTLITNGFGTVSPDPPRIRPVRIDIANETLDSPAADTLVWGGPPIVDPTDPLRDTAIDWWTRQRKENMGVRTDHLDQFTEWEDDMLASEVVMAMNQHEFLAADGPNGSSRVW